MRYIDYWVHVEKSPIPRKAIFSEMKRRNEKIGTIQHALYGLVKLGYIRKTVTNSTGEDGVGAEKTKYVQLRTL
jgi:hypothetical protein